MHANIQTFADFGPNFVLDKVNDYLKVFERCIRTKAMFRNVIFGLLSPKYLDLSITNHTLLFYQIEPQQNGASPIFPFNISRDS